MVYSELRDLYRRNSIERLPDVDYGVILSVESKIKFKAIIHKIRSVYGVDHTENRLRYTTLNVPTTEYDVGVARVSGIPHHYVVIIKYGDKYESFLHVDGIQEERELLHKQGRGTDHPVFSIECLTDILVSNGYVKKVEEVESGIINGWR